VTLFTRVHTASGISKLVGLSFHEQRFSSGHAIVIET
jgi:hypothetical protein